MIDPKTMERDLALFSDPATPFKFTVVGSIAQIKMTRSGQSRDYLIDLRTEKITARHSESNFFSVGSLLASDEFADVRTFASTQRRVLAEKMPQDLLDPAGLIDPTINPIALTLENARMLFTPAASPTISILLIDGPAGVGKTSLIERIAYERGAEPSLPPIFHVTSKGRRLSNLMDAMAKTITDLDARFRPEQIPVLARLNALQVAIDGFDELVQPEGYGNAWGALKDLVKQMGSGGPLILAGRDTFFDQQDIAGQLDKSLNVNIQMVRLNEVSNCDARKWLETKGWNPIELDEPDVKQFFKRPYTRRPFFLSQIATLRSFEDIPAERGSPQAILIDSLLARESHLLPSGLDACDPIMLKGALNQLCEEIATDMAERESDIISIEFLEFVCAYVFGNIIGPEEAAALTKKIGTLAILEPTRAQGERKFPHSEIQNHFLARALHGALAAHTPFPSLRTALYGADLIEAFADVVRIATVDAAKQAVIELKRLLDEERFAARLASNASALLIASLVRKDIWDDKLALKEFSTHEARVFDELAPALLKSMTIIRLDARAADLTDIVFDNCFINALIVDQTTRFGTNLPSVATLQIDEPNGLRSEHVKHVIDEWLLEHSPTSSAVDQIDWRQGNQLPFVKYFDRVCRRFMRQHYIRSNETDDGYYLLQDTYWPAFKEILEQEQRLSSRSKGSISGRPDEFYHVIDPGTLLSPTGDEQSLRIRSAVIKKARELASDA